MRIAINTLPLLANKAGAERYTENILKYISKVDKDNEYSLILSKINKQYYEIKQNNFKNMVYKVNTRSRLLRIFGEQFYIPLITKRLNIDVFFSPCNIVPRFVSSPAVVMLFDLHWFIFPEIFNKLKLAYLKKSIGRSVQNSYKILTVSENSKKDIIEIFKIPEEKIKVIYVGLDPIFKKENDEDKRNGVMSKYGINKKFILSVCQLHRRKNILRLVKAFSNLKEQEKINHKLVIVGGKGDGYSEIISFINEKAINDILITGCIPDEDICLLYNAADLMVYPSLYEGFGMPVVEAMACGCPVVTSNVSSLPEVVGDAAVLVDPYSDENIADAIYSVISNKPPREGLIEKGFKRAKEFSWEKAAQETLKIFEEVYNDMKVKR